MQPIRAEHAAAGQQCLVRTPQKSCPDVKKTVEVEDFSLSAGELAMIDDAIVIAIELLENEPAIYGRPSD